MECGALLLCTLVTEKLMATKHSFDIYMDKPPVKRLHKSKIQQAFCSVLQLNRNKLLVSLSVYKTLVHLTMSFHA